MAEPLVCAHHRHPLASDRIEHRTHVVHPLLQRREPVERDRVGKAHPLLVERDQPAERSQSANVMSDVGDVPSRLHVAVPRADQEQVQITPLPPPDRRCGCRPSSHSESREPCAKRICHVSGEFNESGASLWHRRRHTLELHAAQGIEPARTVANLCHAEGRWFESHHPLGRPCKRASSCRRSGKLGGKRGEIRVARGRVYGHVPRGSVAFCPSSIRRARDEERHWSSLVVAAACLSRWR